MTAPSLTDLIARVERARDTARATWWEPPHKKRTPNASFDAGFDAALALLRALESRG